MLKTALTLLYCHLLQAINHYLIIFDLALLLGQPSSLCLSLRSGAACLSCFHTGDSRGPVPAAVHEGPGQRAAVLVRIFAAVETVHIVARWP